MTAVRTKARKPASTVTTLADHAHDVMTGATIEVRTEALTELLCGLGIVGRKVAEHAGLAVAPKRRKPVDGEKPLPFRKPRRRAAR